MKKFCENTFCESRAVKEVLVSLRKPSDQVKSLCATCHEVYTWGVQHGRMIVQQGKTWIIAIADRGIVVHAQAYRSKTKAEHGVIAYLREYERYDGSDGFAEACQWLAEHNERLSVEIFEIDALADAENSPPDTANLSCFIQQGGFVVLGVNRQDAQADGSFEAWAYKGPLDFKAATPVTFGLGRNSYEALDVLNSRLKNTMKETLTITLKEQCADTQPNDIKVKLIFEDGQLWIQPEGYGDKCSVDGYGCPVGLEIWENRLRLIVFDDINREEPRIIDLENARETHRIDKDDPNNK